MMTQQDTSLPEMLPDELWHLIFLHLDIGDIFLSCARVCKTWYNLVSSDFFWQEFLRRQFSHQAIDALLLNGGAKALQQFRAFVTMSESLFGAKGFEAGIHFDQVANRLELSEEAFVFQRLDEPDGEVVFRHFKSATFVNDVTIAWAKSRHKPHRWWLLNLERLFSPCFNEVVNILAVPILFSNNRSTFAILDANFDIIGGHEPSPLSEWQKTYFAGEISLIWRYPVGARYVLIANSTPSLHFRLIFPRHRLYTVKAFWYNFDAGKFSLADQIYRRNKSIIDIDGFLDSKGRTPLFKCAHSTSPTRFEACKFLLDRGAMAESSDSDGNTVLMEAVWNRDADLVRLLIERGAHVNARTHDKNENPLLLACVGPPFDFEIATILLENGADANMVNEIGDTILMYMISYRWRGVKNNETVRFLLDRGVNVNAKNKWNENALIYAAVRYNWDDECLRILLEASCEIIRFGDARTEEAAVKLEEMKKKILEKKA